MIAPTSTEPSGPGGPWRSAVDLLGQPLDELVVDRILDVDALDRDADLARVEQAEGGGGVGGALDVGVGEHDHRVLAAELEADRGQRLGRLRHHLLAGCGEPVNITKSASSTSAAPAGPRPVATPKTPSGRPAAAQHLRHHERGQRRHLGRLQDHGVAGGERRDAVAEAVRQREVPGADHADQPDRLVADLELAAAAHRRRRGLDLLVGEEPLRVRSPELERRDAVGEVGELDLVGRAAGLAADRLEHALAVRDQPGAGGHQDRAALGEAQRRPGGLRRARLRRHRGDLGRAEVGDGRDRLAARRVLDLDAGGIAAGNVVAVARLPRAPFRCGRTLHPAIESIGTSAATQRRACRVRSAVLRGCAIDEDRGDLRPASRLRCTLGPAAPARVRRPSDRGDGGLRPARPARRHDRAPRRADRTGDGGGALVLRGDRRRLRGGRARPRQPRPPPAGSVARADQGGRPRLRSGRARRVAALLRERDRRMARRDPARGPLPRLLGPRGRVCDPRSLPRQPHHAADDRAPLDRDDRQDRRQADRPAPDPAGLREGPRPRLRPALQPRPGGSQPNRPEGGARAPRCGSGRCSAALPAGPGTGAGGYSNRPSCRRR